MDTSNISTNSTITFTNDSSNTGANWRNELSNDSRHKIVNKIMDTLQRHMPPTGPDGMTELRKIALRFEEKTFIAAVDQQDYLRKISLKMLSLRNHVSNPLVQISSANNQRLPDPAGLEIPSQMRNAPQSPVLGNIPQQQQTLLQQNLQSAMSGGGIPSTTGLTSIFSSMTSLSQSTSGQDFGSQSAMTNSTGQVLSQNPLIANAQRQLQSRQQQHPQQVAQQHQQTQAQHQFSYQQQLQHQQQHFQHLLQQVLLKKKFQQQSQLAPSILQQQQPPVMQQSQLQSSQQSILQLALAPTLQSTQQSLLRQSQSSALQPTQQSTLQQTSQPFLQQQQQQQSVLQQQPFMLQEQPLSMFNVPNKEQQQHQQFQQIIQSKISQYQQAQQPSPSLLQLQSQQLQQQPQQQLLSQLQHQPQMLQQQQSLLPQSNTVQQDLQQGLHTSGCLLQQQQQSSVEQQKQLLQVQTQRLLNASTTLMEPSGQSGQSTADLQEKIYQKAGCCMPSRACGFKVVNATQWPEVPNVSKDVQDCKLWSNKQDQLPYACVSCRAGMLMKFWEEWSNYVGNVNFVAIIVSMVVFLVVLFCIG